METGSHRQRENAALLSTPGGLTHSRLRGSATHQAAARDDLESSILRQVLRKWALTLAGAAIACALLFSGCSVANNRTGPAAGANSKNADSASGPSQSYSNGTVIEPDDPNIRYIGHWDQSHLAEEAITVNSGSRILCSFTGHTIRGLFNTQGITNPAQIYVSIDSSQPELIKLDSEMKNFTPSPLAGDRHTLQIAVKDVDERANRWVPPLASAVIFKGFILSAGSGTKPLPPASSLKMEFYGDSITQGVRAVSMAVGPDGSDGTKDYAFLTAMAFGALHNQVGFGRQGVIRPGNGEVPPAPQSFGWNFQGSRADPSFVPKVVVVNQGTNDSIYPSSQFRPVYQSYIAEIRKAYPDAFIFCMRPFGGFHEKDVRAAVRSLKDRKIIYVDTTGWLSKPDYTDGIHPTAEGHIKAARKLVQIIKRDTSLKTVRPLDQPWWR